MGNTQQTKSAQTIQAQKKRKHSEEFGTRKRRRTDGDDSDFDPDADEEYFDQRSYDYEIDPDSLNDEDMNDSLELPSDSHRTKRTRRYRNGSEFRGTALKVEPCSGRESDEEKQYELFDIRYRREEEVYQSDAFSREFFAKLPKFKAKELTHKYKQITTHIVNGVPHEHKSYVQQLFEKKRKEVLKNAKPVDIVVFFMTNIKKIVAQTQLSNKHTIFQSIAKVISEKVHSSFRCTQCGCGYKSKNGLKYHEKKFLYSVILKTRGFEERIFLVYRETETLR